MIGRKVTMVLVAESTEGSMSTGCMKYGKPAFSFVSDHIDVNGTVRREVLLRSVGTRLT